MRTWPLLTVLLFLLHTALAQDWVSLAKTASDQAFREKIRPEQYKADRNKDLALIAKWAADTAISGDSLFHLLSHWHRYPTPSKRGVILEYSLWLDTNYSVPYLVYIPRNYDPRRKTALLLYYKGGWLSRKSLPDHYAKEMVADNPTFPYLDAYNLVEIFPALEAKLAIYGYYGYKHLREMVVQTKKLFNIDDNRVYLSGFSDGAKSAYLAAALTPTPFACFYPINGAIVSRPNYPNYTNRPIYSFVAEKDELTNHRSIVSKAAYAVKLGANWICRLLPDKQHFYHPYRAEVLPLLFTHLEATTRNAFPSNIRYQIAQNADEFRGIDWLQMQVNTSQKPGPFHFTDSIHTVNGSGEEQSYLYGENTGQIQASLVNNTFYIAASQVKDVTLYISPVMINVQQKVRVVINGKEVFNDYVMYSKAFMADWFLQHFDRQQLWINKITVSVP